MEVVEVVEVVEEVEEVEVEVGGIGCFRLRFTHAAADNVSSFDVEVVALGFDLLRFLFDRSRRSFKVIGIVRKSKVMFIGTNIISIYWNINKIL